MSRNAVRTWYSICAAEIGQLVLALLQRGPRLDDIPGDPPAVKHGDLRRGHDRERAVGFAGRRHVAVVGGDLRRGIAFAACRLDGFLGRAHARLVALKVGPLLSRGLQRLILGDRGERGKRDGLGQ